MKKMVIFLLLVSSLVAQESNYELGLGGAVISYPNYIGSKATNTLISPIPYIRYEGEKISFKRGGLQYRFLDNDAITVDLSLGGSLPVESDDSSVRAGMEDLDFAFEIGPRLNYKVYENPAHKVVFKLPLRAVISTDIQNFERQGFLVAPNMNYRYRKDDFQIKVKSGPIWADDDYHNYFYGVTQKEATTTRRAYYAQGGYNGYRNTIAFRYKQNNKWNYGAFLSHFNIEGASFDDSPLVETDNALFLGTFISYTFYKN